MFKILEGVTPEYRRELEDAGLLYWRHLPRHAEWRPCPRPRSGSVFTPTTELRLSYAIATLYSTIEYAMYLED